MEVSGQLPLPLYLRGNSPRYLYCRRLGVPERRSGRYGEGKSLLSLRGLELRFLGRPARSLVAIPTELSRLHNNAKNIIYYIIKSRSIDPLRIRYSPNNSQLNIVLTCRYSADNICLVLQYIIKISEHNSTFLKHRFHDRIYLFLPPPQVYK
jgi:hypothetical protein